MSTRLQNVALASSLALSAFSGAANANNNSINIADFTRYPTRTLPTVNAPDKLPIIIEYGEVAYKENPRLCPTMSLKSIYCSDGSAQFHSCQPTSRVYQTGHGTEVTVQVGEYETLHYSNSEMMVQFLGASIRLKEERHRISVDLGGRSPSNRDFTKHAFSPDNPNRLLNIASNLNLRIIAVARKLLQQQCGGEPDTKPQEANLPDPVPPRNNTIGFLLK